MKLHHLRPAPGARKKAKRVGRGHGSGKGKTSGRGTKGTGARNTTHPWFEGGQMPLHRRLPKKGGFSNALFKVEYDPVNIDKLDSFDAGTVVGPEELRRSGVLRRSRSKVKILGKGELSKPLTVKAHAFSATARAKIEQAGGSVEVI